MPWQNVNEDDVRHYNDNNVVSNVNNSCVEPLLNVVAEPEHTRPASAFVPIDPVLQPITAAGILSPSLGPEGPGHQSPIVP